MLEEKDVFEISDSTETFEEWSQQPFISADLRESVKNSAILLVPTIGFRSSDTPNFPTTTEEIFHFFKEHLPADFPVEICINDNELQMLALHSDYKRLGKFLVTSVAVPIFVGILTQYINNHIAVPQESKPQVVIQNTIIVPQTTPVSNATQPVAPPHKKHRPHKFLDPSKVTFTVTVQDTAAGKSTNFHYEGPVSGVKQVTDQINRTFLNEHQKTGN